jgi:hypothetical protein
MKFDHGVNFQICCIGCFESRSLQDFRWIGTSPVDGRDVYRNHCKRCEAKRGRSEESKEAQRLLFRLRQRRRRALARQSISSAEGLSPQTQGESISSAEGLSPQTQGESISSAEGLSPQTQGGSISSAEGLSPQTQGGSISSAEGLSPQTQGGSISSADGLRPVNQSRYLMEARP